jgi:hypothetical protein
MTYDFGGDYRRPRSAVVWKCAAEADGLLASNNGEEAVSLVAYQSMGTTPDELSRHVNRESGIIKSLSVGHAV